MEYNSGQTAQEYKETYLRGHPGNPEAQLILSLEDITEEA